MGGILPQCLISLAEHYICCTLWLYSQRGILKLGQPTDMYIYR